MELLGVEVVKLSSVYGFVGVRAKTLDLLNNVFAEPSAAGSLIVGGDFNIPRLEMDAWLKIYYPNKMIIWSGQSCAGEESMSEIDYFIIDRRVRFLIPFSGSVDSVLATHRPPLFHLHAQPGEENSGSRPNPSNEKR
jgi:hypothetical protein